MKYFLKNHTIVHMFLNFKMDQNIKKIIGYDNMNEKQQCHTVNWSEKVKNLDENIRREIGIEDDGGEKHILIKVQTNASECIEPAFIVNEDDVFLDLFVISQQTGGITSTAVLKNNIQSIGVIGGVSAEKIDVSENEKTPLLDDVGGLYQ